MRGGWVGYFWSCMTYESYEKVDRIPIGKFFYFSCSIFLFEKRTFFGRALDDSHPITQVTKIKSLFVFLAFLSNNFVKWKVLKKSLGDLQFIYVV